MVADNKRHIYPLRQAMVLACDDVEFRVKQKLSGLSQAITMNIPHIDKHVNPFQAGDLISVLGVTRNYKSGLMEYIFDAAVNKAMEDGTNRCGIHVSWEVSTEMYAMRMLSRLSGIPLKDMVRADIKTEDMGKLRIYALKSSSMPIFIIANSTSRGVDGKRSRDRLERTMVEDAIDHIINGNEYKDVDTGQNFDPVVMSFDYLQLIPRPNQRYDRRLWMMESTQWCKDMAFFCGCPVLLGVQAKREVEERKITIPEITDAQETSAVEQYSDAVFSVCIPANKRGMVGKEIDWLSSHPDLEVTRNLLLLALLKQKNNFADKAWPLHVDFQTGNIYQIESKANGR